MDFVALNCNLGLVVQQALNQNLKSKELKDRALRFYVDIFQNVYNKHREQLPQASLVGKAITSKEYPVQQGRQYFEAIIYEPQLSQGGKDNKGSEGGRHSSSKIQFAKIEAMEPKNPKHLKEADKKTKRTNNSRLSEDKPKKKFKASNNQKNPQ